jgi:hypothetical protein
VVAAEDAADAYAQAQDCRRDAFYDGPDPTLEVTGEVTAAADLPTGWNADCFPYGDRDTRIQDLLP